MKYFLLFFLLYLISNSIYCFTPNHFCKKVKNQNCDTYECGRYCSLNENFCESLISWESLMNVHSNLQLKVYRNFIHNIKTCVKSEKAENEYRNQWSHRMNFGWKIKFKIKILVILVRK